jgi:hypothetical protein
MIGWMVFESIEYRQTDTHSFIYIWDTNCCLKEAEDNFDLKLTFIYFGMKTLPRQVALNQRWLLAIDSFFRILL